MVLIEQDLRALVEIFDRQLEIESGSLRNLQLAKGAAEYALELTVQLRAIAAENPKKD